MIIPENKLYHIQSTLSLNFPVPTANMKASAIFTAITFLAAGVIAAPSAEGDALIKRADTCFDCQFNSFVSGRCKGACTGAEEAWGNGGQNCKHCIAGCPATTASDKAGTSAGYPC
ncbi:hypothetical protein CGGC5_v005096 [Colletotrichum fructicola Nara gc5]|uniref:Uncharacterized protein n=1 Tax=Colletotrichum fructicola (strain Nara gc5) TaxID=1213859 RepID=A0A7J6JBM9_COLFN|nr:hypothetical protein CFRS1_v015593 [Colletotrichum fructicola]KAF4486566.1 hypothetical protein CGGC5_v005096 [Colletotrichum fructicola Nara gc5]